MLDEDKCTEEILKLEMAISNINESISNLQRQRKEVKVKLNYRHRLLRARNWKK